MLKKHGKLSRGWNLTPKIFLSDGKNGVHMVGCDMMERRHMASYEWVSTDEGLKGTTPLKNAFDVTSGFKKSLYIWNNR